jgi:nucleoid-associated protein YgaU
MTSGVIGLAARVAAAAEAARVAAAAEAARVAAAAEAARVAAAAEAARVAAAEAGKKQKELTEILSLIPSIAGLALDVGDLTNSLLLKQKCVKGKTIKYVKKGAKCPKGYVKKK